MGSEEHGVPRARWRGRLIALACAIGCSASVVHALAIMAGDPNGDPPDSPEQRVDPNSKVSPWAGVGAVAIGGNALSGTLIARDLVLTAAHVVGGAAPAALEFVVNFGRDESQRIRAAEIFVHPEYGTVPAGPNEPVEHDLAIIRLSEPVEAGVPIYPMLAAPLAPGQTIVFVGYGASGNGVDGPSINPHPHIKRVGSNRIDRFFMSRANADRRIGFLFDFDGPTYDTNVIGPNVLPHASLGNRAESTFSGGDSGGPSFVRDLRGRWVLAGVNTFVGAMKGRTASKFGSVGGGILVSAYTPWIDSIIKKVRAATEAAARKEPPAGKEAATAKEPAASANDTSPWQLR
jgi:hypothetical protein